jgi:hypothetical protein
MARPSTADISHTSQSWDAGLNAWRAAAFVGPFPVAEYADEASLPAAAAYDRCVAATADGRIWRSDGTDWAPLVADEGGGASFGAGLKINCVEEELTALAGATVDSSIQFPAGCIRLGVTTRVTTLITGATSFDVGEPAGDTDLYGSTLPVAADGTSDLSDATASPLGFLAAAQAVRLTANGSNFTAGAARVCLHYLTLQAPTL